MSRRQIHLHVNGGSLCNCRYHPVRLTALPDEVTCGRCLRHSMLRIGRTVDDYIHRYWQGGMSIRDTREYVWLRIGVRLTFTEVHNAFIRYSWA